VRQAIQARIRDQGVLNNILLFAAIILFLVKIGFGAKLREIGRVLDRLVTILLYLMLGGYAVQVLYLLFKD
jgi:ABC-type transport system involved in cytochrome c biogenesis permease component